MVGDVDDEPSIDAITKQTRVVLSCAGPFTMYLFFLFSCYLFLLPFFLSLSLPSFSLFIFFYLLLLFPSCIHHRHGTPMVASCVRNGTDYCDITGEFPWIRKLVDAYDVDARRTGALIVNCCGMDCVPSDLGTFFVTSHVKKTYAVNCESVKCFVSFLRRGGEGSSGGEKGRREGEKRRGEERRKRQIHFDISKVTKMKGGVSGGTIASALAILGSGPPKGMSNPYYLIPDNASKVKQPNDLVSFYLFLLSLPCPLPSHSPSSSLAGAP